MLTDPDICKGGEVEEDLDDAGHEERGPKLEIVLKRGTENQDPPG